MKTVITIPRMVAVALAIAVAAAAGITLAARQTGVINGCYKSQNGQLRVVDGPGACLPSETPISWNQVGPQGATGPTGPRGPSDAYDGFRFPGNTIAITGTNAARTRVLAFNIPAGSFAITSKVNVSASAGGGGLVNCVTQTQTGYFDMGLASIGANGGETLQATLSTTFGSIEATPGLLTIDCWRVNGVGAAPIAGLAEAVAVQVANISIVGF